MAPRTDEQGSTETTAIEYQATRVARTFPLNSRISPLIDIHPCQVKNMSIVVDYTQPTKPTAVHRLEIRTNFNFDLIREVC